MATHKSAEKADRQAKKRAIANKQLRSQAKNAVKKVRDRIAAKAAGAKREELLTLANEAQSTLMRVASKGIIRRETASRYVSRLNRQINREFPA